MKYETIRVELDDNLALITLNRPEKRNALSPLLVEDLCHAFQELELAELVRAVILTGEGDAFCAGADLAHLQAISQYGRRDNIRDSQAIAGLFQSIYAFPRPVIAAVNGPALAGGCGLATVCDLVLAAEETARFGYTVVKIGFVPAIVLNFLLRRVGGVAARELALTGRVIDARRALELGLINEAVPRDRLLERARDIARAIAEETSGEAVAATKWLMNELDGRTLRDGLALAVDTNVESRASAACQYGIRCFLNKEKPEW
jgi:methylglutaconyl-CoA hydratase